MGNHSAAQYELLDSGLPFLIERNTGILTTIAVFHDKVGDMYNARILVRDNYGVAPSLTTICDLRVRDWLLCLLHAYWFVFQVYVVSDEYRIIVTISLSIDFVRSNIVTITKYGTSCFVYTAMCCQTLFSKYSIFQQATGCLIGIDIIRPRTSDGGELIDISQYVLFMSISSNFYSSYTGLISSYMALIP